jgi:2Fe-2S ferredoxin
MVKITFIDHKGTHRTVEAVPDKSVMEAAVDNSIPGIDADCGGACACATCHVHVDPAFMGLVGQPGEIEESMLAFADGRVPNSRLSCQIKVSAALEGLVVTTPENQH